MTVVMKCNIITVIIINTGSSDNRSAKITTNIFNYILRFGKRGLSINIKAVFMFSVTSCFNRFKRRTDILFKKIKQNGAKGITEKSIVEMFNMSPKT